MSRTPLPGYRPISYEQILQADKELFRLISDKLQDNFLPGADNIKPVDVEIERLQDAASVSFLLLPLPSSQSSSSNQKTPVAPPPQFPPVPPVERWGRERPAPYGKGKGG